MGPTLKATAPATAASRRLARVIVEAVRGARSRVSGPALVEAVARGDVRAAAQALGLMESLAGLSALTAQQLRAVLEASGRDAATALSRQVRTSMAFDVVNPRSVAYVRDRAGELTQEFNDSSLGAVRAVLERSFQEGIPPRRAARLVRETGIGLTERQAAAVMRLRARMEEAGAEDPDGAAERYADRLLRYRSEVIARTETVAASTFGQQEAWREAVDAGLLGSDARQEWVTTIDGRQDEDCEDLDGAMVGLGEPFAPGVYGPPLHPDCRCAVALRPLTGKSLRGPSRRPWLGLAS